MELLYTDLELAKQTEEVAAGQIGLPELKYWFTEHCEPINRKNK